MPRPEKVQAVADIKERIEDARAVFVTEFRGLSVKQLSQLRRNLRDTGADYKVVKMTLARRATDELGIEGISEHLVGPTGLTFATEDAVATAKALRDAGKENERLVIKAGILQGGQVILPEQISKLADIEPREVLLSKIAGAAKAPMVQLASLVGSFTRNAATMFSQLLEKKESAEPVAVSESGTQEVAVEAPAEVNEAASGDSTDADTEVSVEAATEEISTEAASEDSAVDRAAAEETVESAEPDTEQEPEPAVEESTADETPVAITEDQPADAAEEE
jgi:large subunit ribosomal protein L10